MKEPKSDYNWPLFTTSLPNYCSQQQRDSWMLCPPITERSWEPMTVEEDQKQEETKEEEEDDNMKALSCMDRVRRLNNLSFCVFIHYYSTEEHIFESCS